MNKIDLQNIKNELEWRKTKKPEFKVGGKLSKSDIINAATENLEKMVAEFENQERVSVIQEIKSLVDEAFNKFSTDPSENMIILGACCYYEDSRHVSLSDNPLTDINFTGFANRYNKLAYPIGREYDLSDYEHKGDEEDDKKYGELMKLAEKIESLMEKLGLKSIQDYWQENNDSLNELWYGVHAITKDYKIVSFVIRNDGMLCDEESLESFHNHILYEL